MTHQIDEREAVKVASSDESNRRKAMRAIAISSLGLLATSVFELFITVLSGSVALLSDALHNLGDVFTTVGVYFGFRASRKPPTARYPYGYGRAEDMAGVAIVAAIWSSAVLAGWQSYEKLVSGRVRPTSAGGWSPRRSGSSATSSWPATSCVWAARSTAPR